MGITLFLITLVALLIFGYYQAKKANTVLLDDGFISKANVTPIIGMDFGQGKDNAETIYYTNASIMTPKEYGIRYGNGKSRIKKSNRLHFKK